MRIIPILLLILLISAIVLPVAAEDSDYDDMLNKTQKLNIIVPEKGTAVMGTKESMLEYVDWLNASSDALNAFFDKIMNMFGLGNTTYAQEMKETLKTGRDLSPSRTEK